jgi:hypothetical protein
MEKMKQFPFLILAGAAILSLPLLLGLQRTGSGDLIYPQYTATPQSSWEQVGTLTVQQAYPSVGDRNDVDIDAVADTTIVVWTVPNEASGFMLRCVTTADADSQVLQILVAAGDKQRDGVTLDDYMFGGSLALTGGKQVASAGGFFCDTATATDGCLDLTVFDSGNDRVALVTGDAKGFKRFAFCASTLASKTELALEVKFW